MLPAHMSAYTALGMPMSLACCTQVPEQQPGRAARAAGVPGLRGVRGGDGGGAARHQRRDGRRPGGPAVSPGNLLSVCRLTSRRPCDKGLHIPQQRHTAHWTRQVSQPTGGCAAGYQRTAEPRRFRLPGSCWAMHPRPPAMARPSMRLQRCALPCHTCLEVYACGVHAHRFQHISFTSCQVPCMGPQLARLCRHCLLLLTEP